MLKRRALATSTVVFGFLVAASCGDSSDSGDGSGGKGTSGDAGEAGEAGTSGTGTGGATGGTAGNVTGGTAGNTSGSGGEPADGGEPGGGGMPGDGGMSGEGGEPATGGTMAGSGGSGAGAGGMAGKAGASGAGGSGGGPITCPTPANFDEDWAARICRKNNDCCAADITTCTTNAQTGILQLYPALEASIAANQAAFNCDDYIACMTAIDNASCTGWPLQRHADFGIPVNEPRCRTFIRPLIASGTGSNGPACTQDYQCDGGYCVDPDGTATAQAMQCVAFRDFGLTCEAVPAAGEAHLVCNPVTGWCEQADANVPGTCRIRGVNGANCTAANQCQSRECSTTCVAPTASACPWIPTPPASCSVSSVGSHTGSLGWLAIAGFIGLGAAGRRRRRH